MVESFVQEYGLIAICALMFCNGLLSGPPSELILGLGGIWASATDRPIWQVILCGSVGNLLGTYVLYFIGYYLGYRWVAALRRRLGESRWRAARLLALVLPSDAILEFACYEVRTHSVVLLAGFRCLPYVRSIISLPAGMYKVPQPLFLVLSGSGIVVWTLGWSASGYCLAEAWSSYHWLLSVPLLGILVAVIVVAKRRFVVEYEAWRTGMATRQGK